MTETPPPPRRRYGTGTDLWRSIAAPLVWVVHFLTCYITAAVFCEKSGRGADLLPVGWVVGVATVVALGIIAAIAASLWQVRARSLTDNDFEFEHNSPEERHRFLSHVALMLCVLSAVAVVYGALPVVMLESCR